jgi:hypothetical protein
MKKRCRRIKTESKRTAPAMLNQKGGPMRDKKLWYNEREWRREIRQATKEEK